MLSPQARNLGAFSPLQQSPINITHAKSVIKSPSMLKSEFNKKEAANKWANRYTESLKASPELIQDPTNNPYLYM